MSNYNGSLVGGKSKRRKGRGEFRFRQPLSFSNLRSHSPCLSHLHELIDEPSVNLRPRDLVPIYSIEFLFDLDAVTMADPTAAQAPTSPSSPNTLTYYHAGPLFTLADLTTNVSLSHLISSLSSDPTQPSTSGRRLSSSTHHFQPVLPQDLEPRVS